MASLDFIPTIEEDDDVGQEESESDEEVPERKRKLKRSTTFMEEFEFSVDGGQEVSWDLEDALEVAAKSDRISEFSSLDAKITRAREMRRLKAEHLREARLPKQRADESREDQSPEPEEVDSEEGGDGVVSEISEDEEEKVREKQLFFEEPPLLKSDISFTDMNLSRPLLKAVTTAGFATPTPIQASTIPVALMGKDICASAATGTGKTAAFMLPILERLLFRPTHIRVTRVLVLVPTRELAIQVHSVGKTLAKHTNIELCLAAGGLDRRSQETALRKNPDVVIATPGRLVDHLHNAPSFNLQTVEILVLDEADRMLDEHFEEQMDEIIRLCPKSRQSMLFSATMTDKVEELARMSLNHPMRLFVDRNDDVADNLRQEFVRIKAKKEGDREAIVTALCCRTFREHCLVFLHTKRLAHRMRIIFGLLGLRANELHGSLTQLQRLEALKQFKEGEVDFLLATDLASRGLDIQRVKTVINYKMPASVKQYIHRVGRTARAGRTGRSVTLVGERERKMLKQIVKQAKLPVKSRVIPPEAMVKYRDKIRKLEPEIKEIMKQEEEEKELRLSELEVNKAKNMIEHENEIFSRPARTWIQHQSGAAGRKRAAEPGATRVPDSKSAKMEVQRKKKARTPTEKAAQKVRMEQEHAARTAKRARKQKKIRTILPEHDKPVKAGKAVNQPTIRAFDRELTDTSKKALKEFRDVPQGVSKGHKFKSRKRYKRR